MVSGHATVAAVTGLSRDRPIRPHTLSYNSSMR
jgi:hypothetical protein